MKKFGIILGALVLVGAISWLVLHEPYRPERLHEAVPAHARFLSVHYDLAGRASQLLQHPLIDVALAAANAEPEQLRQDLKEPGAQQLLDTLLSDRTQLFVLDQGVASSEPVFGLASWVGTEARFLERLAPTFGMELVRLGKVEGVVLHELPGLLEEPLRLATCVIDGMLLGTISSDPMDLREIVETARGRHPHFFSREDHPWKKAEEFAGQNLDTAVWMRPISGMSEPIIFTLDQADAATLRGRACTRWLEAGTTELDRALLADYGTLLGSDPKLVLVSEQPRYLRDLFQGHAWGAWAEFAGSVLDLPTAQGSTLVVAGGALRSKIGGLKVPGIIAAVKVQDPEAALGEVQRAVIDLATAYEFDPTPKTEAVHGGVLYEVNDGLSYARFDPWIIICSGERPFKGILKQRQHGRFPDWGAHYQGEVFLHLNAPEAAEVASKALAAWILHAAFSGADEAELEQMRLWMNLTDRLAPLQEARANLRVEEEQTLLDFTFGVGR